MDAIGVVWPIAAAFVTLVIVLAKMHSNIEHAAVPTIIPQIGTPSSVQIVGPKLYL